MKLKIIPSYTGITELEDAISSRLCRKILFLEILLNDAIPWEDFLENKFVKKAYAEARGWFNLYKTAITARHLRHKPFTSHVKASKPDTKLHRLFWEAVLFAELKPERNHRAS